MNGTTHPPAARGPLPVHWLFLAIYPVLFLYSENVAEFPLSVVVAPMLAVGAGAFVLWGLLAWGLRNRAKAALVVSLLLGLTFSYGHAIAIVGNPSFYLGGVHIGHNKILTPLYAVAFIGCAWAILRTRRDLAGLTRVLNVVAGVLVLFAGVRTVVSLWTAAPQTTAPVTYPLPAARARPPSPLPNIYYVILDGYGRTDVLRRIYGYDNEPFLQQLRDRGFTVADQALANYPQTALSLASSLNMDYLDRLAAAIGTETRDRRYARRLIRDSALFRFLRPRGYRLVAYATGAHVTQRRGMDVWLSPGLDLGEFGEALLDITPAPAFLQGLRRYDVHRNRVRYTLETLPETAQMGGPMLVFAHVLCPHPPFVFDADGTPVDPKRRFSVHDGSQFLALRGATRHEYVDGYRKQTAFIDAKVLAAVDGILARSKTPPIIILQGDHGPGADLDWESATGSDLVERLGILNAYHLPLAPRGAGRAHVPRDITPVNTFRLVLNYYFGADTPLLANRAYFATVSRPYRFIDVTEACRKAQPSATKPSFE